MTKIKFILLALSTAFSTAAFSYEFGAINYDRVSQVLYVELLYSGGEQEHQFSILGGECVTSEEPNGIAMRLADTGWSDTGEVELSQIVAIPMAEKLEKCESRIVNVTLRIFTKHTSIVIER